MEEFLLKRLHNAPFFSTLLMNALMTLPKRSGLFVVVGWRVSVPEEYFIEILPLKKTNAKSIHSALVEYCREKNIQL